MTRRGARLLPSSSWSAGYAGSHGHEDHHQQVVALRGHAEEQDDLALLQSEEALAVALHDFKAAEGDELSIREGEELLVLHRYRDGWCVAQNESSEIGLVPLNHLEVEEEHPTGLAGGGQQQTFRSPAMIPEEEAEKIDAETTASAHEAPDDGAEARLVLQSQMAEYLSNFAIMKKKASSQPPSPQLVTPSAESTAVSPSFPELIAIFSALDKNNDGRITHAEFITGLKRHPWIAEKLGIPANIHQEDGTRDTYQLFFGKLDTNDSKSIEFGELCRFFGFQPDHLCAHIGVKTDRGQFLSPPQNDCTSFNEEMGAAGSLEDQKCGMPRVQEWVVVSGAPSQTSYLYNTHADADMSLLDEDVSCPHSLPVGLDLNDQALEPDSRLCHEQHSTSHLTESSARASHGIPRGNRLEESQPAPELAVHIPSAAHIAQPPNEPAQLSNSRAFHGEVQELNSPRMTGLQEADARDGLWSFCSGIIPVLREVDTVAAGLSRERADAKIKPPPLGGRYLTEEEKEDMDRYMQLLNQETSMLEGAKPSSPVQSPYVSPLSPGVRARRAKREFFKRIISQWTKHSMVECFELWRDMMHSRDVTPHRDMSVIASDAAERLHHSESSEPPSAISSASAAETECVEWCGCDDVGKEGCDFHENGATRARRDTRGALCKTEINRVCVLELKALDPVIARIVPDLVGD